MLHFYETELKGAAALYAYVNEVWPPTAALSGNVLASEDRRKVGYFIDWNEEALSKVKPRAFWPWHSVRSVCGAVCVHQRQGNKLTRAPCSVGKPNGQTSTEGFQLPDKETAVSLATAQTHVAERVVNQIAHRVQVARRRDQLDCAQVGALWHSVNDKALVNLREVLRRIEVLDAGVAVDRDHPIAALMQAIDPATAFFR